MMSCLWYFGIESLWYFDTFDTFGSAFGVVSILPVGVGGIDIGLDTGEGLHETDRTMAFVKQNGEGLREQNGEGHRSRLTAPHRDPISRCNPGRWLSGADVDKFFIQAIICQHTFHFMQNQAPYRSPFH
jgi:hypothetical protein